MKHIPPRRRPHRGNVCGACSDLYTFYKASAHNVRLFFRKYCHSFSSLMTFVISAAAMLVIGAAQAQTSTTCSWVACSTPAAVLPAEYPYPERSNLSLVDIKHVKITPDLMGCTNGCLDSDWCIAFDFNTTTSAWPMYGHNLIHLGLKQQVTGDSLRYNHKCFEQECGPASSLTSFAPTSLLSPSTTSGYIITLSASKAATNTQDSCYSALNYHPKVASSVCGSIDSQTAASKGFKKDCNSDWTSRLSSVCSYFSASNTKFTPAVAVATTPSSLGQASDVAISLLPVIRTSSSSAIQQPH